MTIENYEPGLEFFGALKNMFGEKDMIAKNHGGISWAMKKVSGVNKWGNETKAKYTKSIEACKAKGILKDKAFKDPSYISDAVDNTLGPIIKYKLSGKAMEALLNNMAMTITNFMPDLNTVKKASTFSQEKDIANLLHSNWIKNSKGQTSLPAHKAYTSDFDTPGSIVGITEGKLHTILVYNDDEDYMFTVRDEVRERRESNGVISNYNKWTVQDCLEFVEGIINISANAESVIKKAIENYKNSKMACDEAARAGGKVKEYMEDMCEAMDSSIADFITTIYTLQDHADTILWYGVKNNLENKYD